MTYDNTSDSPRRKLCIRCGAFAKWQCPGCKLWYCEKCVPLGICETDLQRLPIEDQDFLTKFIPKYKRNQKWAIFIDSGLFLFIVVFFISSFISGSSWDSNFYLILILIGISLFLWMITNLNFRLIQIRKKLRPRCVQCGVLAVGMCPGCNNWYCKKCAPHGLCDKDAQKLSPVDQKSLITVLRFHQICGKLVVIGFICLILSIGLPMFIALFGFNIIFNSKYELYYLIGVLVEFGIVIILALLPSIVYHDKLEGLQTKYSFLFASKAIDYVAESKLDREEQAYFSSVTNLRSEKRDLTNTPNSRLKIFDNFPGSKSFRSSSINLILSIIMILFAIIIIFNYILSLI